MLPMGKMEVCGLVELKRFGVELSSSILGAAALPPISLPTGCFKTIGVRWTFEGNGLEQ